MTNGGGCWGGLGRWGGEGGGEGEAAEFAVDEGLHVAEGAEVTEFLVVDRDGEDFLGEEDDLHERQRIEAEVRDEAQLGGGGGGSGEEFFAVFALDEASDDAEDDRGDVDGIGRAAEGEGAFEGGGRAALKGFAERVVVGERGARSGGRGWEKEWGGGGVHGG